MQFRGLAGALSRDDDDAEPRDDDTDVVLGAGDTVTDDGGDDEAEDALIMAEAWLNLHLSQNE